MCDRRSRVWVAAAIVSAVLQYTGALYADEVMASASRSDAAMGDAVDDGVLTAQRGGTQVVNDMKLNGVVSDNQAYNLNTGNNIVSEGAFAGSTGMPMLIQNSGNNVLIQNATILNVQLQ